MFIYTFCLSTWSGASQQSLQDLWIFINTSFDDYHELVRLIDIEVSSISVVRLFLMLISSTHNTRWFLVKTMGAGTNLVDFGKTTHIRLTINRKQAVSLEGLWSNTNFIQPSKAGYCSRIIISKILSIVDDQVYKKWYMYL